MVDVYDHYRPTAGEGGSAVYRVVGVSGRVTLLRVTDDGGRRVNSGELRHVTADALRTGFEPADDPDAGLTPVYDLRNLLSGMYWQVRKFL